MNSNNKTVSLLILLLILGLLLIISVFFTWQYTIQGPCYFSVYKEWSLIQDAPGRLMTRFLINDPPHVQDFNLFQFERQDFIKFSLSSRLKVGDTVLKDDTIGTIYSTENRIRYEKLSGELNVAKANLLNLSTGKKTSVQQEAVKAVDYAKTELVSFEPVVKRKRQLFEAKLVSPEELELTEAHYRLLKLNVSIAEARLKIVQTGEKPEEIELVKKEISALETQVDAIRSILSDLTIVSPLDGIFMGSQGDTIFRIAQIDTMVVQIPVDETKIQYLRIGSAVQVLVPAVAGLIIKGTVNSIDKNPQFSNGRTMFVVRIIVENTGHKLLTGMTGNVRILGDKITLLTFLKRWWITSVGSRFFI